MSDKTLKTYLQRYSNGKVLRKVLYDVVLPSESK